MKSTKLLPDCWWITPDIHSIDDIPNLLGLLETRIEQGITHVQFMQKLLTEDDYKIAYEKINNKCKENNILLLIHGTIDQAKILDVVGCCFYGKTVMSLKARPLPEQYWVGIYCHSLEELKHAEKLEADFASLSIIKPSHSYPEREPIGWDHFEKQIAQVAIPVYAVGGLNLSDKAEALKRGAQGIMGIRYDYPNQVA